MPKIVIKTIAVASFITLNILGGTAWGMWEELDTNTQRRILTAHIKNVTPPEPPEIRSTPINKLGLREGLNHPMTTIQASYLTEYLIGRSIAPHTGGWLDNWPNITIETTCAACKQEIQMAYTTLVLPSRLATQDDRNTLLEEQNDLLRALLLQKSVSK